MEQKVKYRDLVFLAYLLGLISFLFLRCQEITAQEVAALVSIFILLDIKHLVRSKGTYTPIVLILLLYILFEAVRSYYRYGQGVYAVGYLCVEMVSVLIYVYLTGYPKDKLQKYYNIIIKFAKFEVVCLWICALTYNVFGIMLLDAANINLRNGRIRLYFGMPFFVIGMILTFAKIIDASNKGKGVNKGDIFFLVMTILYLIYGCQARMLTVAALVAMAVMYMCCYKRMTKKIAIFLIGAIVLLIASCLPIVQNYFVRNYGGIFVGTDTSLTPRVQAVSHYLNIVKDNKLIGLGLMDYNILSNGKYNIQYILRGTWGVFYTSDVGIFGYYMMYGILGCIIYAALLIKMFRNSLKERKSNPHKLGLVVFIFILSFTATFFDVERQSYWALLLLCFELNVPYENTIHLLGERVHEKSWDCNS